MNPKLIAWAAMLIFFCLACNSKMKRNNTKPKIQEIVLEDTKQEDESKPFPPPPEQERLGDVTIEIINQEGIKDEGKAAVENWYV